MTVKQIIPTERDLKRLFAKIALPNDNGCMLWTGSLDNHGYGCLNVKCDVGWRPLRVHRLTFAAFVGAIPDGLVLDHRCGVRACAAPGHLRAVTQSENMENLTGSPQRPSASGRRNVYWNPSNRKWEARVTHHGRRHFLGLFDDKDEAAAAASAKRAELYTHNDRERSAS